MVEKVAWKTPLKWILYIKKKNIYIYIYFVLLNDMGQGLSSTETFTRGYKTSIDF